MSSRVEYVDITPTPRVLRILGEIPFQPWQCIAELVDNAVDAFYSDPKSNLSNAKITVNWSRDSVALKDRTLDIVDTACGMTIDQLRNAVRAGYTSNDPVSNLGLFGMGFNIATARLGELTEIYTTRDGDSEWIGLSIDLDALMLSGRFTAPTIHMPKQSIHEHGTRILVKRLKSGVMDVLSQKEKEIRRVLQKVYSPLLRDSSVSIIVRGKKLLPERHCVWSEKRCVIYDKKQISAIQPIDHSFGASYFDVAKNRYLNSDESDEISESLSNGGSLPASIVLREKRLHGWIGIQRFADPNDYGIDFIRNGRKILIADKSFFYFENSWSGQKELQYPVELGTSVGGRIVGELHVDYLIPTYQKNDFDRTDSSWHQTVELVCGVGPYLPKRRTALGFTAPISAPLPILCNAYRRLDAGTKCLFAPNAKSKELYHEFAQGKAEYQEDTLWWKLAQEEDQKKQSGADSTEVNPGDDMSDNPDDYLAQDDPGKSSNPGGGKKPVKQGNNAAPTPITSKLQELLADSTEVVSLSGQYGFDTVAPLKVHSYELKSGDILDQGKKKPCFFFSSGIDCTYVYNPRHVIFTQYPLTPKGLLLQYLAEKIKVRDAAVNSDIVEVFSKLTISMMTDSRIDKNALQEKADAFFQLLRERLIDALAGMKKDVLECIHESVGEVEDTITALFPDMDLVVAFQEKAAAGYTAMSVVPVRTLIRLVERYPQFVFDGHILKTPYSAICLADENATMRMRESAKERIMSYLKDAARLIENSGSNSKNELSRASISIAFLSEAIV